MGRVLGGLDICVSQLDHQEVLDSQLSHLRGQHIERNIPAYYFTTFGKALAQVVPAVLQRCFDFEAWEACYAVIASGIKA